MITAKDFENLGLEGTLANVALDFYEGRQMEYVRRSLDGQGLYSQTSRTRWQERGYIPQIHELVKPVVERSSGELFVHAPSYTLLTSETSEPDVNPTLEMIMHRSDFNSWMQTINELKRLLRSVCVLFYRHVPGEYTTVNGEYRFDSTRGDAVLPVILHPGNSIVRENKTKKYLTEVAYITEGTPTDKMWEYRYITPEVIADVKVIEGVEYPTVKTNPYGCVPGMMFYDTTRPITGTWAKIPEDILSTQEAVNLHLTDLNFAMSRNINKPLYTNARFRRPEDVPETTVAATVGNPTTTARTPRREDIMVAGVDSVIHVEGPKNEQPFIEHRGPDVDLAAHQTAIKTMISMLANNWGVNIRAKGSGTATSGFQLVVEELDNLRLQTRRKINWTSELRAVYDLLRKLYPELPEATLAVEFRPTALPINEKEQEDLWDARIKGGRASREEYLMTTQGLSREEAKEKLRQIAQETLLNSDNSADNAAL